MAQKMAHRTKWQRQYLSKVFLVFVILVIGLPIGTKPSWALNPIQIENSLPGTTDWHLVSPASNHEIEGYASLTSVNAGGQIKFFVNTGDSTFTLVTYRMGWYAGLGGRQVTEPVHL